MRLHQWMEAEDAQADIRMIHAITAGVSPAASGKTDYQERVVETLQGIISSTTKEA